MTITRAGSNMTELEFDKGWKVLVSNGHRVASCIDGTYYRTTKYWGIETLSHINRWVGGRKCATKTQEWFDSLNENE